MCTLLIVMLLVRNDKHTLPCIQVVFSVPYTKMHDPAEDIDKLYLAVPVKDPESFVIRSAPLPFHIQDKKGKLRTVIGIMGIYRTILSFPVRLSVLISGSVFYRVIHLAFLFIQICGNMVIFIYILPSYPVFFHIKS